MPYTPNGGYGKPTNLRAANHSGRRRNVRETVSGTFPWAARRNARPHTQCDRCVKSAIQHGLSLSLSFRRLVRRTQRREAMANPRLLVLLTVAGGIFAFGVYALFLGPGEQQVRPSPRPAATDAVLKLRPATSSPTPAGPAVTAAHYFDAWEAGDHAAMALLVDDPPPDFVERHRRFDAELRVRSLTITPGDPARRDEDRADVPFDGERMVEGLGEWPFSSVLRLTLRNGTWKVLWTPETLHPSLKDG